MVEECYDYEAALPFPNTQTIFKNFPNTANNERKHVSPGQLHPCRPLPFPSILLPLGEGGARALAGDENQEVKPDRFLQTILSANIKN